MRGYGTATAIKKVLEDLRNIKQKPEEAQEEYCRNEAIFRCGNAHSQEEKIALHVDWLSNTNRTVVGRYHERVHRRRLTLDSLCHFVK